MGLQLTLIRHGQVAGIAAGIFRGRLDLALTDVGLRQASATAARIAEDGVPAALYTSPQRRAVQTATIVGAALGLEPQTLPQFCDIDYGEWQGRTEAELPEQRAELALWHDAPQLARIPNGESLADVAARASRTIAELLRRHAAERVVLVGHDSINRVAILHALDLPLGKYWSIGQDPCAISVVDFGSGDAGTLRVVLRSLNETHHLRGL